jgi:4-hydroxy-tetrahydrodipicolinate reductase
MTIALIGHGKMGKEVEAAARERQIPLGGIFDEEENPHAAALTPAALRGIDACIDFSTPTAVLDNIRAVTAAGCNMVVGTTGWYEHLDEVRSMVLERNTGFLYAANFSLGVNIFSQVVSEAARLFDRHPEYDVAVTELHHRGKADSPSGTALSLGSLLLQSFSRKSEILGDTSHGTIAPQQLHVSSTRVGHITGRHSVIFDSEADTIELSHTARNRRGFALGALVAAQWLKGKKGFFTMRDVILS